MIKKIFTVYDRKAQVYSLPFFAARTELAIRDYQYAQKDPASDLSKYPDDFVLCELGTFDDHTAVICMDDQPIIINTVSPEV
nr:MAG: nonstructural protein [Microvirus sp.]